MNENDVIVYTFYLTLYIDNILEALQNGQTDLLTDCAL